MKRLETLEKLKTHAIIGKFFKKLKSSDLDIINKFLIETQQDDVNSYAEKVNRLFLDKPDKPKQWVTIWAILTEIK